MTSVVDVVLVHGWGLNRAIWSDYLDVLECALPDFRFHCVDIPGYGYLSNDSSSESLRDLTNACLAQAPQQAVWVGWSLGGMIAMRAALDDVENDTERVRGLQLISSTAKFTAAEDWPVGVDITVFHKFCGELTQDYSRALGSFLLLQAGVNKGARALARSAQDAISEFDNPSELTLMQGIRCLEVTDLRSSLGKIKIPSQVVMGTLDRVSNPQNTEALATILDADLVSVKSGHAPFLTNPDEVMTTFSEFLHGRVNATQ